MIEDFQEQQAAEEQTESSMGMVKLLGIFLGGVVVCAIFFSLGYTVGRKSAAGTLIPEPTATANHSTPKPSPSQLSAREEKASETSGASPQAAAQPQGSSATSDSAAKAVPEMQKTAGAFVVQVAAVSRQEDAEALVSALRKKDYPVFVINNAPGDRLFHVQVGPFAELKDAEAIKSRLAGDGYNPIVKR